MKLTGHEAIEAKKNDNRVILNKYADPIEDARENISLEDAEEIASEDPGLIYTTDDGYVKCIDCSIKVVKAIEARTREITAGYNGGDLKNFALWVLEALDFDPQKEGDDWKAFENWSKTADGAVVDAVWDAWTDF
jgi:hypothetical protein